MISYPVRISNDAMEFLKKIKTNRIRVGTEERPISFIDAVDLLVKFFKLNNDQYLRYLKMENKKDGS